MTPTVPAIPAATSGEGGPPPLDSQDSAQRAPESGLTDSGLVRAERYGVLPTRSSGPMAPAQPWLGP